MARHKIGSSLFDTRRRTYPRANFGTEERFPQAAASRHGRSGEMERSTFQKERRLSAKQTHVQRKQLHLEQNPPTTPAPEKHAMMPCKKAMPNRGHENASSKVDDFPLPTRDRARQANDVLSANKPGSTP